MLEWVKRRMEEEEKTADEVLGDYPALTEQDIADIKTKL